MSRIFSRSKSGNWKAYPISLSLVASLFVLIAGQASQAQSALEAQRKLVNIQASKPEAPIVENSTPIAQDPLQVELATAENQPTLRGTTAPNSVLKLTLYGRNKSLSLQGAANTEGKWQINLPEMMMPGVYQIYIQAKPPNNVQWTPVRNLTLRIDRIAPTLNVDILVNQNQYSLRNYPLVNSGSRLIGIADGTGSSIRELRYQIGDQPKITIPVSENGLFNVPLDIRGLAAGSYPVRFSAVDMAGNQKIFDSYKIKISSQSQDVVRSSAQVTLRLLEDTGESSKDHWTSRPEVVVDLISGAKVKKIEARLIPRSPSRRKTESSPSATAELETLKFTDISSWLNLNSLSLLLSEKTITDLDYARLPSGSYTLEIKGDLANSKSFTEKLDFVLDRQVPNLVLANADGIAWDWNDRLRGILQDDLDSVKIDYRFSETETKQVVAKGLLPVSSGRVDVVVPELIQSNKKLREQTRYTLDLTVRDLAGNQQKMSYRFLILSTRELTDEDYVKSNSQRR
jgi:Bacterial Ig-like domain (group 3)